MKKVKLFKLLGSVWVLLFVVGCSTNEKDETAELIYSRKISPYYTVQEGETVESIAHKFSMKVEDFISLNDLISPYTLYPGQKVIIYPKKFNQEGSSFKSTVFESGGISVATKPSVLETLPVSVQPEIASADIKTDENAPAEIPHEEDGASDKDDATASSSMRWPVRGKVIKKFGQKKNGQVSKGISIAAPEGTPVYATMPGTVFKSNVDLEGFGKTVIIQHSDQTLSVYSHLKVCLVKEGQKVDEKTVIGRVGKTGGLKKPELHFQIRKEKNGKKTPIDPLTCLK